jgi:hypothetical protein
MSVPDSRQKIDVATIGSTEKSRPVRVISAAGEV